MIIDFAKELKRKARVYEYEMKRNEDVKEKLTSIKLETVQVKDAIVHNLIFDYLILDSEKGYRECVCSEVDVKHPKVEVLLYHWCACELSKEFYSLELIREMSLEDMRNYLKMANKRLILFKVEHEFAEFYAHLKERAERTATYLIGDML